jgi:hypothetical protein
MSYMTPAKLANKTGNSTNYLKIVEVTELPKPSKNVSELLIIEEAATTIAPVDKHIKGPKAFDFNLPAVQNIDNGHIQIHSFGVEQVILLFS